MKKTKQIKRVAAATKPLKLLKRPILHIVQHRLPNLIMGKKVCGSIFILESSIWIGSGSSIFKKLKNAAEA
jgi:hypothetical protein